jgi:hypothetical protein
MTGVEIPSRLREEWAAEVESERALEAAQREAEHEAAAAGAAAELADVKARYELARAKTTKTVEGIEAVMTECAELRTAYEDAWRIAASLDAQDLRLEPLNVGEACRAILSLTGRL